MDGHLLKAASTIPSKTELTRVGAGLRDPPTESGARTAQGAGVTTGCSTATCHLEIPRERQTEPRHSKGQGKACHEAGQAGFTGMGPFPSKLGEHQGWALEDGARGNPTMEDRASHCGTEGPRGFLGNRKTLQVWGESGSNLFFSHKDESLCFEKVSDSGKKEISKEAGTPVGGCLETAQG